MAAKDETTTYEAKAKYYQRKKELTEERISLIEEIVKKPMASDDALKINSFNSEVVELEASLEGINAYWNHYSERLQEIRAKEEVLTVECNENFKLYYDMFTSISPASMQQYSGPVQQQYVKILPLLDKEWEQKDKNALYALMKDLLQRMKKI